MLTKNKARTFDMWGIFAEYPIQKYYLDCWKWSRDLNTSLFFFYKTSTLSSAYGVGVRGFFITLIMVICVISRVVIATPLKGRKWTKILKFWSTVIITVRLDAIKTVTHAGWNFALILWATVNGTATVRYFAEPHTGYLQELISVKLRKDNRKSPTYRADQQNG